MSIRNVLTQKKTTLKAWICFGCGVLLSFGFGARAQETADREGGSRQLKMHVGQVLPPYLMPPNSERQISGNATNNKISQNKISQNKISQNITGDNAGSRPREISPKGRRGAEIDIISQSLAFEGYGLTLVYAHPAPSRYKPVSSSPNRGHAYDIVMSMPAGNELGACYSRPYIYYRNVAMSLSSRRMIVDGVEDLRDRRVTGLRSAVDLVGANFANLLSGIRAFEEVTGHEEQIQLLFAGVSDFAVGEVNIFNWLADRGRVTGEVRPQQSVAVHPIFNPTPKYLVFHDEAHCQAFNRGLTRLRESGGYQDILDAYGLQ